jgi:hypothetical protein
VPTSVLLAVLAAAGLLALAPALTRRYDATERVAAERATSTARVLARRRRRRTVPGPRPINPPSFLTPARRAASTPAGRPSSTRQPLAGQPSAGPALARQPTARQPARQSSARQAPARQSSARQPLVRRSSAWPAGSVRRSRRRPVPTALHRRRRVLVALLLLNLAELAGVLLVGPGFWIGFAVTFTILLADLAYLRHRAVLTARARRVQARRQAWIAREQAAVRREHDRRAREREAAVRRLTAQRDHARREAARQARDYMERYTPRSG